MHRQPYGDAPLRVTGSVKLVDGSWRARLRIGDESRPCGYRDQRITLGPAHAGKGDPAPGTFSKRTAKLALDDLVVQTRWAEHERKTERQTFAAAAKAHVDHLNLVERVEAKTSRDYETILDERILPVFGHHTLDSITSAEVSAYRDRLIAEGKLSARSIRRDLGLIRSILARAVTKGTLDRNVADADAVKRPKMLRDPSAFSVLTIDSVRAVGDAAATPADRVAVLVAAFAGLRLGEIIALKWCDVDGDRLHVRRAFNGWREKGTKSGKARSVPIALELRRALDELRGRQGDPRSGAYVLTGTTERAKADAVRRGFYLALDSAHLGHLREGERPIRFHDLRHGFISHLVGAGVPLTAVMAFAGHVSLATTSVYAHHADTDGDVALVEAAFRQVAT